MIMNRRKFSCCMDSRSKYITSATVLLVALGVVAMYFLSAGDYLPAWSLLFMLTLGALCALSVPRFVRLSETAVEIHCTVEITELPYDMIRSVRMLPDRTKIVPLVASFGFFGYFGFYLDIENWDIVRLYSGSMRSLVEIEDIFERRYAVGVSDPQAFIEALRPYVR